jgi:heme-degrading monooxygenase HmoA
MYLAMNHFHIAAGRGGEFEQLWRERETYLSEVPGFLQFHLVRGKADDDGTERYASHSTWATHDAFLAWTHSDAFKKAHAQGRMPEGLLLGHPRFQGWETVELSVPEPESSA